MRERMPRALRNALADLILAALDDDDDAAALARLGGRAADTGEDPAVGEQSPAPRTHAERLVCAELASAAPAARAAVRERVARALAAVATHRRARALATDAPSRPASPLGADRTTSSIAARGGDRTTSSVVPGSGDVPTALRKAAALFNAELYFEVHEVLEAAWGTAKGATRVFLQGLLQIAVALHHATHGNDAGARRLLEAGRAKVLPHAPAFHGVDVAGLLDAVAEWERARAAGVPQATPPRLAVRA